MIPGRMLRAEMVTVVALGWTLFSAPKIAFADDVFFAVLNSNQEIQNPKPNSNALGNALMTYTKSDSMLCYSISYTALVAMETAAHFHGPASAGQNASILFPISVVPEGGEVAEPSPFGSPKSGCVGPLSNTERSDLRKGLLYINIHSEAFPAGEIRGQVLRVKGAKQAKGETVADTES